MPAPPRPRDDDELHSLAGVMPPIHRDRLDMFEDHLDADQRLPVHTPFDVPEDFEPGEWPDAVDIA